MPGPFRSSLAPEFFRGSLFLARIRWILIVVAGALVALLNIPIGVPANPRPFFAVLGGFALENTLLTLVSRRGLAQAASRLDRLILEWQALGDQFLLGALILVTGGIQSPVVFVTFASLVATTMTVPPLARVYAHGALGRGRPPRPRLPLPGGQTFPSQAPREETLPPGLKTLMRASRTGAAVVWLRR